MDTAGTIDWKRAVVPEGRTLKAAQLQFYEWKKLASAGSNGTAGESPSATPRKRKQAKKISDNNGVDDKEPPKNQREGRSRQKPRKRPQLRKAKPSGMEKKPRFVSSALCNLLVGFVIGHLRLARRQAAGSL